MIINIKPVGTVQAELDLLIQQGKSIDRLFYFLIPTATICMIVFGMWRLGLM